MAKPRTPDEVKKLNGTFRADRARTVARVSDPLPDDAPWLEPGAAEVWRRLAPLITELGTGSAADAEALAQLCRLTVTIETCTAALTNDKGEEVLTQYSARSGTRTARPEVGMRSTAMTQLLRFYMQFGLTPSSRLEVAPAGGDDPLSALQNDSRGASGGAVH